MAGYPKVKLVKLERLLAEQHERKRRGGVCRSPHRLSVLLGIPAALIRRIAWECGLDPFPGAKKANDMRLAVALVTRHGAGLHATAAQTGFTPHAIECALAKSGWSRYVVWGRAHIKLLVLPPMFAAWRLGRRGKAYQIEVES